MNTSCALVLLEVRICHGKYGIAIVSVHQLLDQLLVIGASKWDISRGGIAVILPVSNTISISSRTSLLCQAKSEDD